MTSVAEQLRPLVDLLLGHEAPVYLRFWDGSALGSERSQARVTIRSPRALQRMVQTRGELGLSRAYVSGELDIDGDVYSVLDLQNVRPRLDLSPREWITAVRAARSSGALRLSRPPLPPEEARLRGRRHSPERDAAAIRHHYDVSNEFYRIVLGPTLTYSCAYFASPGQSLEDAQTDKHELICRKLRLRPGERLLDVGCGWGSLVIHAAANHGVHAVGVTLSRAQADLAAKRVAEAGVADRVEIRVQDERDVNDGPYDAIASVGMFEHVGAERLARYFDHLYALLRPTGRLLNHGIARPPGDEARFAPRGFINRYVFPDGELHEIGRVLTAMQNSGFEIRDLEGLREHYALTLRHWVRNLEAGASEAVAHAGEGRFRVWRLYMAGSALAFERGMNEIHQVLAVRADGGVSRVPLRRADLLIP